MPGEGPHIILEQEPLSPAELPRTMDSLAEMERLVDAARPAREQAWLMAPNPFDFGIEDVRVVALEVRRQPGAAGAPSAYDELRAEWERRYAGSDAAREIHVIHGDWDYGRCFVTQQVTLRPLRHTFELAGPEQEEFTIRFVE